MQRRTFVTRLVTLTATCAALPRRAWAQLVMPTGPEVTLLDVAIVVLPRSLGSLRVSAAVQAFEKWTAGYKAGAEISPGYGVIRLQTTSADPSANYAAQLAALQAIAEARGRTFRTLDLTARETLLADAIVAAGVDTIPRRPDGRHIATDLMSHFLFINDAGHDYLYNAQIGRGRCRGLESSGARPAEWSRG